MLIVIFINNVTSFRLPISAKGIIDNIFLSVDPGKEKVYERSELSSEQVFRITSQYTTLYKNKKLGSFTSFAKEIKARYLKADISRKRNKDGRVERKILYVMKPNDRGNIIYWLEEAVH